ncbi:MAG TPA: hypothetical protein VE957_12155 [Terriglobales bacterium]|nr:hypothetical protein [Terriglobales bacterium]
MQDFLDHADRLMTAKHAHVADMAKKNAEEMKVWQTGNTNMPETVPPIFAPPSADDPILAEVVRRLQELYHPEQI